LVLAIKFQNRLSSAIQLSKPFEFGHWVVSTGGFNCFYLQVWLKKQLNFGYNFGSNFGSKIIITFCSYLRFWWFLRLHIPNGEFYLFKSSLYYFIIIFYIILMLLCKNIRYKKSKINCYKIIRIKLEKI
jgi:hypothetical protein